MYTTIFPLRKSCVQNESNHQVLVVKVVVIVRNPSRAYLICSIIP